ncbi:uncharacterized protein LOC144745792 [Ciona intestinalis]
MSKPESTELSPPSPKQKMKSGKMKTSISKPNVGAPYPHTSRTKHSAITKEHVPDKKSPYISTHKASDLSPKKPTRSAEASKHANQTKKPDDSDQKKKGWNFYFNFYVLIK